MSVLKYFKNTPGRPHRSTGPKCNFFSSNLQRGLWKKRGWSPPQRATGGPVAPPSGDQWAQPTGAAGGPVVPPAGDRGIPLI